MSDLLPFLVVGLTTGSLYGLAGVGLVLTYRTSGVFNLAHGAVAAAAAFCFYELHFDRGMAWPFAALIVVVAFGVVAGLALELITRGLSSAPQAVVVVATVGLLLLIQGSLYLIFGDVTKQFPTFLPDSGFTVSDVIVTWAQVISALIALAGAIGLYLMLRLTKVGVSMLAVVDDPNLVRLTGVSPRRVRGTAWVIGCAFAAMSGILLAPTLSLDALLLTFLVIQALGACAVGRFTSLPLTFVGGLGVGVLAALATRYFTDPSLAGLPSAVPLVVLVVALLIIPVRKLPRGQVRLRPISAEGRTASPLRTGVMTAIVLGGLLLVPHVVGTKLPVWINALTQAVIFGSLALLVWTSGQISLCHASFVALGATNMAHLQDDGLPWLAALLVAGLLTVPVGALIAIPAIRLSGIYLALVTLGFGVVMQVVVFNSWLMFGSAQKVTGARPEIGPFDGSDQATYYAALAVAVGVFAFLAALQRARLGRLLRAMAESPTLLATSGLGVNLTRLLVFCISAFLAGIGGALALTQFGSISGVTYGPLQSLLYVAILALGGTGLITSSIVAALLSGVVPGYVTQFGVNEQLTAFGAAALIAGLLIGARPEIATWTRAQAAQHVWRLVRSPVASRHPKPCRTRAATELGLGTGGGT